MPSTTFVGHFLGPDTHANRPAVTGLANGTQYFCTTHNKVERVVSGAWADYYSVGGTETLPATIFDAKGDVLVGSAADAAARLAVGTDGQVLTADSAQTLGVKWATPSAGASGAMTLLHTLTLGSAGTFDQASISGAYNDLVLVLIARASAAGGSTGIVAKFNNDSGANYYSQRLRALGSSAQAAESIGTVGFQQPQTPAATNPANMFSAQTWTLYGYASTAWLKTVTIEEVNPSDRAASGIYNERFSCLWDSTAAINRVSITSQSGGNFVTGSQLRIYGRL